MSLSLLFPLLIGPAWAGPTLQEIWAEPPVAASAGTTNGFLSGEAHGAGLGVDTANALGAEAVQILGEIVVSRAQQAAFEAITREVQEGIRCGDPKTSLPATCAVVSNMRLEDLAMAPEPLIQALLRDALTPFTARLGPSGTALVDLVLRVAADLADSALRVLVDPTASDATALHLDGTMWALVAQAGRSAETLASPGDWTALGPTGQTILLAGSAVVYCQAADTHGNGRVLDADRQCVAGRAIDPVVEAVEAVAGSGAVSAEVREQARALAANLQIATSGRASDAPSVVRARARAAVSVAFDLADALVRERSTEAWATSLKPWLPVVEPVLLAALGDDPSAVGPAVLTRLPQILELTVGTLAPDLVARHQKAFGVLSTLTAYSATVPAQRDGTLSDADAYAARKALLESLTAAYTSRRGREGDLIVSLAGTFAVAAGARVPPGGQVSFAGPLALPLGVGVHHVPAKDGRPGFVGDVGLVDLGQYVSWSSGDGGFALDKPDLAAALAPSLGVGMAWGASAPLRVGVRGGYTPAYGAAGGFQVGAEVGVYVPLFDVN